MAVGEAGAWDEKRKVVVETMTGEVTDYGKTAGIRLIDVFLLGPLMLYGGLHLAKTDVILGSILAASGVLTVLYNGRNYLEYNQ